MIRAVRRSRAPVVFPAHPRTRKILETKFSKDELPGNLVLTNPLGYVDMIALISNARGVLTDSGGIQKESFILGTRCFTLRENTEWAETLTEGRNRLIGLDEEQMVEAMSSLALDAAPQVRTFGSVGVSARVVHAIDLYRR